MMKKLAWLLGLVSLSALADQPIINDFPFPENYAQGQHYRTAHRGNIREEMFVSNDAIQAVKNGKAMPNDTVITLVDYRNDKIYRYVTMTKKAGSGKQHAESIRTGDWQFAEYGADKKLNRNAPVNRCMACHQSVADQDYVFSVDAMKNVKK